MLRKKATDMELVSDMARSDTLPARLFKGIHLTEEVAASGGAQIEVVRLPSPDDLQGEVIGAVSGFFMDGIGPCKDRINLAVCVQGC